MAESKSLLGPPIGYTDIMDLAIVDQLRKEAEGKPRFFPIRPSSSGKCSRALAYDLAEYEGMAKYEKAPREPEVFRLLRLGHSVEYSSIKNFELIPGLQIRYKQQVVELFRLDPVKGEKEGRIVEGSLDLTLFYAIGADGHKGVMDVKSFKDAFSKAFRTRQEETIDKLKKYASVEQITDTLLWINDLDAFVAESGFEDFLVDNLLQLNGYACSEFLKSRGVDHASVYRYNKNDSRHYEIRFRPSERLHVYVREKFSKVYSTVMEKKDPTLVPRDFVLGSMRCAFCDYRGECWSEDARKAWLRQLPPKQWPTDIHKIREKKVAAAIANNFTAYEEAMALGAEASRLEGEILAGMAKAGVAKLRLENGNVYEAVFLKSPRPHFELRRSKA